MFSKVFQANFDRDTIVRNALLPTILARIVRLHIVSWNVRIAMRMEFIGTYEGNRFLSLTREFEIDMVAFSL